MQKTTIPLRGKLNRLRITYVTTLMLITFFSTTSYAQNRIEIQLVNRSDSSIVQTEHYHLFEIANKNSSTQKIDLKARTVSCNRANIEESELSFSLLDENHKNIESITLAPNQKLRFVLKTKRSEKTTLNSWNCIEVYAEDINSKSLLSSETIKSLIPNPTSFN